MVLPVPLPPPFSVILKRTIRSFTLVLYFITLPPPWQPLWPPPPLRELSSALLLTPAPLAPGRSSGRGDRRSGLVADRQVQRVHPRRARHRRRGEQQQCGAGEQPIPLGVQRHTRAHVREGRKRAGALHARDVRCRRRAGARVDGKRERERERGGRGRKRGERGRELVARREMERGGRETRAPEKVQFRSFANWLALH